MTSPEKDNTTHIRNLCEKNRWFGRTPKLFSFFSQPMVPVISVDGLWVTCSPLKLVLKPGGHGVMWKLALDQGVFPWFQKMRRDDVLVRQINNPIAGTDYGLIALLGIGCHYKKAFGFASCHRPFNMAEGMVVLVESTSSDKKEYCITNIEYTEFTKHGIPDVPEHPDSPYSLFPTNTNILFANLPSIEKIIPINPIPGKIINLKTATEMCDSKGTKTQVVAGRLESTMQNIADSFVSNSLENLHTFVTYNDRKKTISVTKRGYSSDKPLAETPQGAYFDLLHNHYTLLKNECHIDLPPQVDEQSYKEQGPAWIFHTHPSLGPIWSIIGQKIQGGTLAQNSELKLEIAELELKELHLQGSLLIEAESILGHILENTLEGKLTYSEQSGKATLIHCRVENLGIDRTAENVYWKSEIHRKEALNITLKGNGEFYAENVIFRGNYQIEVPNGHKMVASMDNGNVKFDLIPITAPTWYWKYQFEGNTIKLVKEEGRRMKEEI
jgi:hypothetical protein